MTACLMLPLSGCSDKLSGGADGAESVLFTTSLPGALTTRSAMSDWQEQMDAFPNLCHVDKGDNYCCHKPLFLSNDYYWHICCIDLLSYLIVHKLYIYKSATIFCRKEYVLSVC